MMSLSMKLYVCVWDIDNMYVYIYIYDGNEFDDV